MSEHRIKFLILNILSFQVSSRMTRTPTSLTQLSPSEGAAPPPPSQAAHQEIQNSWYRRTGSQLSRAAPASTIIPQHHRNFSLFFCLTQEKRRKWRGGKQEQVALETVGVQSHIQRVGRHPLVSKAALLSLVCHPSAYLFCLFLNCLLQALAQLSSNLQLPKTMRRQFAWRSF